MGGWRHYICKWFITITITIIVIVIVIYRIQSILSILGLLIYLHTCEYLDANFSKLTLVLMWELRMVGLEVWVAHYQMYLWKALL